MLDPQPIAVRCPSCGGKNVRVVGQRNNPPGLTQTPPTVTRNYQCVDCFHRWDVTAPVVDDSRPA